jgi:sugar diacid utilization regulator
MDASALKSFLESGYRGDISSIVINPFLIRLIVDEDFTEFLFSVLPTLSQDLDMQLSILISHQDSEISRDAALLLAKRYPTEILHLAEFLLAMLSEKDHPLLKKVKDDFLSIPRDMYLTASAYLKAGLNATKASEKLYVHRNTFRYRLNQFIEISSLDIRDHFHALYFIIAESLTRLS